MKTSKILLLALIVLSTPSSVFASERTELLGTPQATKTKIVGADAYSNRLISPSTVLLAQKIGIYERMQRLQRLRRTNTLEPQSSLELLALKQDLTESILVAAFELRTVVARINENIANANEIYAHLAERRDRAVRLNTYADFISGGITGIIGSALDLGKINPIPGDVIDGVEGAVQTGLASWAFKQQQGEKRLQQGVPNMLTNLLNHNKEAENDYPPSVWAFLNLPVDGGRSTVLNRVVDRWVKLDLCLKHSGHKEDSSSRLKRIASTSPREERLSIDILEDRIAMLTDLHSSLQHMDFCLLELFQFLHGSKEITDLN